MSGACFGVTSPLARILFRLRMFSRLFRLVLSIVVLGAALAVAALLKDSQWNWSLLAIGIA